MEVGGGGAGEFGGAIGITRVPFRAHDGEKNVEWRRAVARNRVGGRGGHRVVPGKGVKMRGEARARQS